MKGKPLEQGEYKVLAVENNKDNGMQAMTVVQVKSKYKTNRDFKT